MFNLIKLNGLRFQFKLSRFKIQRYFVLRQKLQNIAWFCSRLAFLAVFFGWHSATAETFNDASEAALNSICQPAITDPGFSPTTQLEKICKDISQSQNGQPSSSGAGTQSQPNSLLIAQQQLKDHLIEKEKKDMVQGGSADSVEAKWNNFSTFLSAGATTLRHRNNDYEQGYNASIPSVTLGGGYRILKNLETGVAFNYSSSMGGYFNGGGFNVNSYTPLVYVNFLPVKNAFATLALGYTRQNQSNNRIAVANKKAGTGNPNNLGPIFRLNTTGNVNANLYNLNFFSGYDHQIENIHIGPRFGVDVRQWELNSYQESSQTGLELRYNSQYQTSIQTRLGLAASFAHRTTYGTFVPQLTASWLHEYANHSRTVSAQFVQAPDSPYFSFQTENPARNWVVIDLGVSLVMEKNVQAFVNFSTVQGNRNFESYGGNIGVQMGF